MSSTDLNLRMKLVSSMGLSLHRHGTNAYRLEEILRNISTALQMNGQFFSTPTYLAMAFSPTDSLDETEVTKHLRVLPGEADLSKLQKLDSLAERICVGNLDIKDALIELSHIESEKNHYSTAITLFSFSLVSMAISLLLNGGLTENILSAIFGLWVGVGYYFKTKYEHFNNIYEFFISFTVTMFLYCIFNFYKPFNFQTVLISSLIIIIPGLSLTIAMIELATQNLASGTARLMGSLVDLLKLAFGIYIGLETASIFFYPIDYLAEINNAKWALPLSVFLASIGFNIVFKALKSDFIWILYSGVIAVASLKIGLFYLSPTLATFISAFMVGLCSNIFSRFKNRPAMTMLLPGMIFMVPGSIGLKGLSFLMQNDFLNGVTSGIQMFTISISIVAGLFFSNVILKPRKGL